ncbi:hypothetical protein D3C84_1262320 [compost metagenome]
MAAIRTSIRHPFAGMGLGVPLAPTDSSQRGNGWAALRRAALRFSREAFVLAWKFRG